MRIGFVSECLPDTHVIDGTPAKFAERVVSLLREPNRGCLLDLGARVLTQWRYSWQSRAAMFERLDDEVLEGSLAWTPAGPGVARPPR